MKILMISLLMMMTTNVMANEFQDCKVDAWKESDVKKKDKALKTCFKQFRETFTTLNQCIAIQNEISLDRYRDYVKEYCVDKFKYEMETEQCIAIADDTVNPELQDSIRRRCICVDGDFTEACVTMTAKRCLNQAHTMNDPYNNNKATKVCLKHKRSDLNMSSCITAADTTLTEELSDELKIRCVKTYGVLNGRVACEQAMGPDDTEPYQTTQRTCCMKTIPKLYIPANKPVLRKACYKL